MTSQVKFRDNATFSCNQASDYFLRNSTGKVKIKINWRIQSAFINCWTVCSIRNGVFLAKNVAFSEIFGRRRFLPSIGYALALHASCIV